MINKDEGLRRAAPPGYAIKLLDGPGAGMYVKAYDPTYMDGIGEVVGTLKPEEAKQFPSLKEAMVFWKQQYGVRADGKPNRPLTASSVEITRL